MLKAQGRRGEVAVELHTSFLERFKPGLRVFALEQSGERRELHVEEFWPHKGRLVLKFADIDSISDAETLARCELQVPIEERAPLEAGAAYVSDLIGCMVSDQGREIGKVADVQFGAGEAPLLMVREGNQEYLIPFADQFLEKVDVAAKEIRLRLPEGMLEVNAPVTKEEKRTSSKQKE